MDQQEQRELQETVVQINRVSKKTKGGNQMRFSVLVVVGDRGGKVGVGKARAGDVAGAVRKAMAYAKKRMIKVPLRGTTLPYALKIKYGAAKLLVKPAPPGSGIIAGGALRVVFEAAGVQDVVAKILGSNNKVTNVYALMKALDALKRLSALKNET